MSSALLIIPNDIEIRKKSFKFANYVADKDDILKVVDAKWKMNVEGFCMYALVKKLKALKSPLNNLNWKNGDDVCKAIKEFFVTGKLLGEPNATIISLVPKLKTPLKVSDFRPILCCNVVYKCISRQIQDNILLAQELMKRYEKSGGPKRVAFKIDIQKAYDTCNVFLLPKEVIKDINRVLKDFLWRQGDVCKGRAKIASKTIYNPKTQGGLGLKDMFTWNKALLVKHIWNIATKKTLHGSLYKARPDKEGKVTDMFHNGQWKWPIEWNEEFPALSNIDVPSLNPGKTDKTDKINWINNAGDDVCKAIKEFFVTGKLLGEPNATIISLVPKLKTPLKVSDFRPILCCNVVYKCIKVIKDINRVLKDFLWRQGDVCKGRAKIASKTIYNPKTQGGLGLKDMFTWNKALLVKHIWNIATKKTLHGSLYKARPDKEGKVTHMFHNGQWKWPIEWNGEFLALSNIDVPFLNPGKTNKTDKINWINNVELEAVRSELGAVEPKLCASMAEMMKMLSTIKLSNEQSSPKVGSSRAYMAVNEGPNRLSLKFDDLGFPIPSFKEKPKGSNHGGKCLENENRIEEYTPFKEPGMLHHGNRSNHHGSNYRMRKLKMSLFDGEDSNGWIYKVESKITFRSWEGLKRRLLERFQPSPEGTLYEQLLAITQEAVRVMQPEGLNHAMKLATVIDENKVQSSSQVAVPSGGQPTIKGEHFRRMIESKLEERRAKGLCFRCEEKFKPSHWCACQTLQVMIVDDYDEENEPYLQVKPWYHALKAD
ncbi:hypothetical protein Tco_0108867 [Tanacetum coccineum]